MHLHPIITKSPLLNRNMDTSLLRHGAKYLDLLPSLACCDNSTGWSALLSRILICVHTPYTSSPLRLYPSHATGRQCTSSNVMPEHNILFWLTQKPVTAISCLYLTRYKDRTSWFAILPILVASFVSVVIHRLGGRKW